MLTCCGVYLLPTLTLLLYLAGKSSKTISDQMYNEVKEKYICGAPIAQLEEHKIGNIMVISSSPALGISRNGPPVHPVTKWVPGISIRLASVF